MELIDILNDVVAPIILFGFFIYVLILWYKETKNREKRVEEMYKKERDLLDLQFSNEKIKKNILLEIAYALQES